MQKEKNKAGYSAIQSRMIEQEQFCENRSQLRNVMDGPVDQCALHGDYAKCESTWPLLASDADPG